MRVLVVEDNDSLGGLLRSGLGAAGFTVDRMPTLADAREAAGSVKYDAIVLDLALPDGDGLTLLKDLRIRNVPTPVLILSARDRLEDRIHGLNAGADDYLPKPFSLDELVARLNALLRRPPSVLPNRQCVGNVAMDINSQEVEVDGRRLDLPRRERALLRALLRNGGRLVTRAALEEALFGFDDEVGSNAIEVYIHRLRKRLEAAGASAAVHTERGVGYGLVAGRTAP
ncbi:MAG: response regulator transcription factor [Magnetospirillum sp.]|nr:response regulator transcription factor [Magnetospirillum sp.]